MSGLAAVRHHGPGLAPTVLRRVVDDGHFPPQTFRDCTGAPWRGTSRIVDPAGRRHANRRSWLKLKAEARRAFVEAQRLDAIRPELTEAGR